MSWSLLEDEINVSTIYPPVCIPIPAYHPTFIRILQVCVNITCILSMLGCTLIIATFVAFKQLRTGARRLLVMLSIADFLVAASQFAGVNINLPKYAKLVCRDANMMNETAKDLFCEVQGGITLFSTTASLMWTMAVAIYLFVIIVFESQKVGRVLMYVFFPLCWGIAVITVVTVGELGYLGFHENVDKGWCYLKSSGLNTTHHNIVAEVLSQLFIYLTYFTLIFIYVWIRCTIRSKIKKISEKIMTDSKLILRTKSADFKLTFIPIIFVFLRIWGTALGIAYIYVSSDAITEFRKTKINAVFVFLAAIGSSAQGLMNALLFCLFTAVVRKRLWQAIKHGVCCYCYKDKDSQRTYLLEVSNQSKYAEVTTDYDHEEILKKPLLFAEVAPPPPTAVQLVCDSMESSKYHTMSFGKRITRGTE